ncbi:T9SS type A sorting domain-containing protein [candidate division WOR-3 bacterium]|nr:T9SS type A sorting domain-containing protein [candidate division WOR-3 bacterium]
MIGRKWLVIASIFFIASVSFAFSDQRVEKKLPLKSRWSKSIPSPKGSFLKDYPGVFIDSVYSFRGLAPGSYNSIVADGQNIQIACSKSDPDSGTMIGIYYHYSEDGGFGWTHMGCVTDAGPWDDRGYSAIAACDADNDYMPSIVNVQRLTTAKATMSGVWHTYDEGGMGGGTWTSALLSDTVGSSDYMPNIASDKTGQYQVLMTMPLHTSDLLVTHSENFGVTWDPLQTEIVIAPDSVPFYDVEGHGMGVGTDGYVFACFNAAPDTMREFYYIPGYPASVPYYMESSDWGATWSWDNADVSTHTLVYADTTPAGYHGGTWWYWGDVAVIPGGSKAGDIPVVATPFVADPEHIAEYPTPVDSIHQIDSLFIGGVLDTVIKADYVDTCYYAEYGVQNLFVAMKTAKGWTHNMVSNDLTYQAVALDTLYPPDTIPGTDSVWVTYLGGIENHPQNGNAVFASIAYYDADNIFVTYVDWPDWFEHGAIYLVKYDGVGWSTPEKITDTFGPDVPEQAENVATDSLLHIVYHDANDECLYCFTHKVDMDIGVEEKSEIPTRFVLFPIAPNPARGITDIAYSISKDSKVSLKVYDITGSLVTTLVNDNVKAGKHTVHFDTKDFASGVYFYRLTTDNFDSTKKMVILR